MEDWQQIGLQPWAPWEKARALGLTSAFEAGGLHSAILLKGARDLGKRSFAAKLASFLVCDNVRPLSPPFPSSDTKASDENDLLDVESASSRDANAACGHCPSCMLLSAGNHPDFYLLQPEEGKKIIGVDSVRAINEALLKTPQVAARRVCIIEPVDQLNDSASNALLKLLEEPPEHTYFLLIADHLERVLPTIRSRCQSESFGVIERQLAVPYLAELYKQSEAQLDPIWQKHRGFVGRVIKCLDGELSEDLLAIEFVDLLLANRDCFPLVKKLGKENIVEFAESCQQHFAQRGQTEVNQALFISLFLRAQAFHAELPSNPNLTAASLAFFEDCTALVSQSDSRVQLSG